MQIIEARRHIERDSAGRAVIFSTHIMQEAAALCSRVVVMHRGRILAVERPSDGEDAGQQLEVALDGLDEAQALALVAAVPGVLEVEPLASGGNGEIRLLVCADTERAVADGVARALPASARLREIAIRRPSLEERFVRTIAAAHTAAERQAD